MQEIIENRTNVYLPEDIQKITSKTRESIYYLNSLEAIFQTHVTLKEDSDKELFELRIKRITDCRSKFDQLESIIYKPKNAEILANGTFICEIEAAKLVETFVKYLRLKETIDNLQLEILQYLNEVDMKLISVLKTKEYLSPSVDQYLAKVLTHSIFEHSFDEDRLDNYIIYFLDEKEGEEYLKENSYPIHVKVRNNEFLLNKYHNLYKVIKNTQIHILTDSSRLEEEEQVRRMSIEQITTNKKMKHLTVITAVIAIIGFFYASLSTYLLLTDNTFEIEQKNNSYEQELLIEIKNILEKRVENVSTTDSLLIKLTKAIKVDAKSPN